jgi:hypothetical protein
MVANAILLVGSAERDWRDDRSCLSVRFRTNMNGTSAEARNWLYGMKITIGFGRVTNGMAVSVAVEMGRATGGEKGW